MAVSGLVDKALSSSTKFGNFVFILKNLTLLMFFHLLVGRMAVEFKQVQKNPGLRNSRKISRFFGWLPEPINPVPACERNFDCFLQY